MAGVAGNRTNSGVAGALALALAFTPAAFAEPAANTNQPQAQTVSAQQLSGPVKPRQAMLASDGKIVLYYGEGIRDVQNTAEILNERGYPAIALPGSALPGKVTILANMSIGGTFDQSHLDRGIVGVAAIRKFTGKDAVASVDTTQPTLASN
jgi:hypothetical protein